MKKFKLSKLLLSFLVLLVITLCKIADNDLVAQQSSYADVSSNDLKSAHTFNYQNTIDMSSGFDGYHYCTRGILKVIKGIIHEDFNLTINGNKLNIISYLNTSDFKLIDEATGIEYTGSYVSNDQQTFNFSGSNSQWKYTSIILLTARGSENNIKLLEDHYIIYVNGELEVNFDRIRFDCQ